MIGGAPAPWSDGSRGPLHQRGMTLSGFLFQLAIWGFLGLLAIKIGPIYFDHYLIRSTLESLEKDRGLATKTREEILELLRRRWEVNNIENVTAENVKITRDDGNLQLHLVYDVTKPVVGNVEALVHFDDLVIVGQKVQ
jgi:Domain of unknown function (DUF4845)